MMDTYWSRLVAALHSSEMDVRKLATILGVPVSRIAALEPSGELSALLNLKAAFTLSVHPVWLATGKGEKYLSGVDASDRKRWDESLSTFHDADEPEGGPPMGKVDGAAPAESDGAPRSPAPDVIHFLDGRICVPLVRFVLTDGNASFATKSGSATGATGASDVVLPAEWCAARHLEPTALYATTVDDTSMEDCLYQGDTVVINTHSTAPKDLGLFAVNYEGVLLLRRLVRDGGAWWLAADSAETWRFPRKVMSPGITLVGEVVFKQSEHLTGD